MEERNRFPKGKSITVLGGKSAAKKKIDYGESRVRKKKKEGKEGGTLIRRRQRRMFVIQRIQGRGKGREEENNRCPESSSPSRKGEKDPQVPGGQTKDRRQVRARWRWPGGRGGRRRKSGFCCTWNRSFVLYTCEKRNTASLTPSEEEKGGGVFRPEKKCPLNVPQGEKSQGRNLTPHVFRLQKDHVGLSLRERKKGKELGFLNRVGFAALEGDRFK